MKNLLLVCLILVIPAAAHAQSRAALLDSAANALYKTKDYQKAAGLYEQAFAIRGYSYTTYTPTHFVRLAACYSLQGMPDRAFHYLYIALEKGLIRNATLTDDPDFNPLKSDSRWPALLKKLEGNRLAYINQLEPAVHGLSSQPALEKFTAWKNDPSVLPETVYRNLTQFRSFPKPLHTGVTIKLYNQINDTLKMPFYVYVPRNYRSGKPSKTLVYIPGGWWARQKHLPDESRNMEFENPTFPYLDRENMIGIFPAVDKRVAMFTNEGYRHIEMAVKAVKRILNVDDNAVFLSGFSDGGSSTYNIAAATPNLFAKFYPINGWINGRSYLSNFANRAIMAFSAEHDMYSNRAILTRAAFAKAHGADFDLKTIAGEGHFYYPYEEKVVPFIFRDMRNSARRFPPGRIRWFTETANFNGCDWLMVKPDTLRKRAGTAVTDTLRSWDMDGKKPVKIPYGYNLSQTQATYANNTFDIRTSQTGEISLLISPEMVDLSLPVRVMINGREMFNKKIGMDKEFMINNFIENFDRVQVWVNKLSLKVPD